ncbi:unnamed protein product [Leptosia nina]|uniref:Uncharacterized protein n=1 Tax=Leptosia nina TaxID=320188 RepID=A0AAV1JLH4_9NEOP
MLNISQSEMELRRLQSNEFSPQNSVDQIIRKYTEKRSERFPINNTNTPSKNESYMISTKIDTSKDRAINSEFKDNTLFNFITNYKPEDIKNEYNLNQYDKHSRHSNVAEERSHKKCIDKSTHCRPVLNLYNEGFIFKTLEENVKLTSIVKRLFYAHQREKEHEAWKNFINLLKNKHKQDDNSHINKNIPNFLEREYDSERLEDYYITKFKSRQSNTYKTLLDDIYRNSDEIDNSRNLCDSKIVHQRESHTPYRRYSVCYPTSSLGRLTVLQREKERLARIEKHEKSLKENRNKKIQNKYLKKSDTLDFYQPESICSVLKSEIVQTESVANKSSKTKNNRKIYKNYRCEQNTQTLEPTNDNVKNIPLKEIENKLETLINSINGLIDEFKKKRKVKIESKNNGLSKHFDGLNSIIVSNDDEKKLKESRKKYYSSSENALPRDTSNILCQLQFGRHEIK